MNLSPPMIRVAGWIGAILIVSGIAVYIALPERLWPQTTLLALGAVHLIVFFIGHFETFKGFSRKRSTRLHATNILMTVLFIFLLGILNFIASRHPLRWDLSSSGAFTLSPETIALLKQLKQDVKILAFFPERGNATNSVRDLLENYRVASSKIQYEMIDPDKKPDLAQQHKVTEASMVLISGSETAKITEPSEQEVTTALIRLSRSKRKALYFVEGHGEHALDDTERSGYSAMKAALSDQGFVVHTLFLLSAAIPKDASVVIIAGPQSAFTDPERQKISDYLLAGGRLFLLWDPAMPAQLEPLLSAWNVQIKNDIIVDPASTLGGVFPVVVPGKSSYPDHAITRKFALATFYPLARSLLPIQEKETGSTPSFKPLVVTSAGTWSTTPQDEITINPEKDTRGPLTLGAVVQGNPLTPASPVPRLVIFGDSDFPTNAFARSAGNGDLFQNVVSWLAEEKDLISIRPRPAETSTLLLSRRQSEAFFAISVILLPLSILGIGLIRWHRRRKR